MGDIHQEAIEQACLEQMAERMLAGLHHGRGKSSRFRRWARRQLHGQARQFFAAEPAHLEDLDSLHEFRIRGKDLRYAMELLAAAFPPAFRTELYPLVETLQEQLGDINDHAVAVERFRQWRKETKTKKRRKHFQQLIRAEKRNLQNALWEFAKWWTPHRSKRVQSWFHKLVNGDK